MKVINLFGGPGAGKSTTAAGLFWMMKLHGDIVELVTEYAKELVWDNRRAMFEEQAYIFAKQNHRIYRLAGQVDYVITDSPLLLSAVYAPDGYNKHFFEFVRNEFLWYDNINIYLRRTKPYSPIGRLQETVEEAKQEDMRIAHYLEVNNIPHTVLPGDEQAAERCYGHIRALEGLWETIPPKNG